MSLIDVNAFKRYFYVYIHHMHEQCPYHIELVSYRATIVVGCKIPFHKRVFLYIHQDPSNIYVVKMWHLQESNLRVIKDISLTSLFC